MRIDVSSALILFYLALAQSLFIKEQGDKRQKAALPLEQSGILLGGYNPDFQGSCVFKPLFSVCCLRVKEEEKGNRFEHLERRCVGDREVPCVSETQTVGVV